MRRGLPRPPLRRHPSVRADTRRRPFPHLSDVLFSRNLCRYLGAGARGLFGIVTSTLGPLHAAAFAHAHARLAAPRRPHRRERRPAGVGTGRAGRVSRACACVFFKSVSLQKHGPLRDTWPFTGGSTRAGRGRGGPRPHAYFLVSVSLKKHGPLRDMRVSPVTPVRAPPSRPPALPSSDLRALCLWTLLSLSEDTLGLRGRGSRCPSMARSAPVYVSERHFYYAFDARSL